MQLTQLSAVQPVELAPGVRIRLLFGQGAMLSLVEIDPGGVVPLHSHPHEQLGYVVSGELRLTVAGVEHRLHPTDGYQLEGGIEHSATSGPDGCLVLDVFHPVREDYRERARAAGQATA